MSFEREFAQPVDLAKILRANGLRLNEAHAVLNRLAEHRHTTVTAWPADQAKMRRDIEALGLKVTIDEAATADH